MISWSSESLSSQEGNRDDGADYLASHDLPFEVGIAVVLAGPIMAAMVDWLMGASFSTQS